MTLIERVELTSAQASITFSNIPGTYTDLLLLVSSRGTDAFVGANIDIKFNANSSGYSARLLYGTGSSAASATGGSTIINWAPTTVGGGGTSNTFGNASIYIPNYSSSSAKSVSIDAVAESNVTGTRQDLNAALWNNTAAITSIAFTFQEAQNFAVGSSISLYGITKGSDGTTTVA